MRPAARSTIVATDGSRCFSAKARAASDREASRSACASAPAMSFSAQSRMLAAKPRSDPAGFERPIPR
ncbi:hypothetical protein D3C83_34140 [compost metagenome]